MSRRIAAERRRMTVRDRCREAGISPSTFYGRRGRGLSPDQALNPERFKRGPRATVRIGGRTIAQVAQDLGVREGTLRERLARGWSDDEILGRPVKQRRFKNPGKKLTRDRVDEIKESLARGDRVRDVAEGFDVTVQVIYLIRSGKIWKS